MRDFRNPRYKVLRDREECIECDLCVRQCANEVHYRDEKTGALRADSMKCVNCQRCTLLCPTRALAITRWPQVDAGSAVWTEGAMDDITAQAQTGGVLLASMGNPKSYHIYWEHLLLNASQVTNPSIDPLREPMETRVVLGSRPSKLRVNERTRTVVSPLPPQLSLDVPIMFSAMSFGSVSLNTQKALAMAARELGTYFNCGEGGLHRDLEPYADRAIVQVASGRFGVDPHYLNAGAAIEIKIGQGAKPGIGGHLPGEKINEEVSRTRMIPEGSDAISPAPHHDIYSIEDLAQLIYDLKNANTQARISVKLVSEAGVGTVAAGVAKAGAQVILVSGYDGGTGAAPRNSIHNAGLPWELGLAETHQTLIMNGLRNKVRIETDGKLMSGRDVAIAAILGAEEFGFATAPLVTMGCVMMRVCNLDTCPVGVATQNPELRKNFRGKPEYVENFMKFIAQELREYMAALGVRTVDELVGRTDLLKRKEHLTERQEEVDLTQILSNPYEGSKQKVTFDPRQVYDFQLEKTLDEKVLLKQLGKAIDAGQKRSIEVDVSNTDRAFGTILGSEITRKLGDDVEEDTYHVLCKGAGGQSFGAFIPKGLTLELVGDSNDYFGKGLSGGKLVVYPPQGSKFKAEENIIIGNVALYGATSGKAFINGVAGERFCVRNSGAIAVVEGVGDHGCEYMTGGRVVVLGPTGKNFAAGMSGGIAYVLDEGNDLYKRLNKEMVSSSEITSKYDVLELKSMIQEHVALTNSAKGKEVLDNFGEYLPKFKKIIPHDYERVLKTIVQMEEKGLSAEQAQIEAFYANTRK